jgi:hypothetical protein
MRLDTRGCRIGGWPGSAVSPSPDLPSPMPLLLVPATLGPASGWSAPSSRRSGLGATRSNSGPPATPLVAAAVFEMADRLLRGPGEATPSAALGPLAAEARYVSRKVSYSIRRGAGTSIPLQAALLAHHR